MGFLHGRFQRFLYTDTGRILLSILLGLGVASLFRKVCKDKNCIQFRGPSPSQVESKTFQFGDRCVKYEARATTFDAEKKTVAIQTDQLGGGMNGNPASTAAVSLAAAPVNGSGGGVSGIGNSIVSWMSGWSSSAPSSSPSSTTR